jgi:hypothetical protein
VSLELRSGIVLRYLLLNFTVQACDVLVSIICNRDTVYIVENARRAKHTPSTAICILQLWRRLFFRSYVRDYALR